MEEQFHSYVGVPSQYEGQALLDMLSECLGYMRRKADFPITHLDICMRKPDAVTKVAIEAWALMHDVTIAFYPRKEADRRLRIQAARIRADRERSAASL